MAAPTTTAPSDPPAPGRSRTGRILVTIVVVALLSMWGYVVYLAFGPGRADSPDTLDDPAFATAAQKRCDGALDLVAALPTAADAADAVERAGVIDEANRHFGDMLDDLEDLRDLVPADEDRKIVTEWLDDWRTFLGDRGDYADELRVDADARLLVTAKGGQQVTVYIDEFAKDNDMPACSTPLDA